MTGAGAGIGATPATMPLRAFARHIRRAPSWVMKLKAAGRLVMTDDGMVRVAESIERIAETTGGRDDVLERNELARRVKEEPKSIADSQLREIRRERAAAELRLKVAQADAAEFEARRKAGEFLRADDAKFAAVSIAIAVRDGFEGMAGRIAPALCQQFPGLPYGALVTALEIELHREHLRFTEALQHGQEQLDEARRQEANR